MLEDMNIQPNDRILEIGCGWGECAIRAVERYGCQWTALTLSPAQYSFTKERIRQHGLEDKIQLKLLDYRWENCLHVGRNSLEKIDCNGTSFSPINGLTKKKEVENGVGNNRRRAEYLNI
ncbi:hypothetical protein AB6A40_006096 [Gnathostoma spinigerum]|uniref:Cyclopropane-fatty-acyl-phospholipid synthase n=1 Tax=Gnathostoma spinigerum TaxID=75299 RepID=A0ABD6ES57_9BILA